MEEGIEGGPKSRKWIWILLIAIVVLAAVAYFVLDYFKSKEEPNKTGSTSSGEEILIPEKVLGSKFGWLGGGADDDGSAITEMGGAWVRPHPGAFVWDAMQKSKTAAIDFSGADEEIQNYGETNLGILATIWPFADWDQKTLADVDNCKVGTDDEFLPKNDKKGRGSYLPQYRCNPSDWEAYQSWVEAIVERYDGDGVDDMPKLQVPVKYWEVMNEPDLQYQSSAPQNAGSSLNFYKQGPSEYAELLIATNEAIKAADPDAQVLIAGAAGADSRMLGFYTSVFENSAAKTAFDIGNVHCISNDQQTHDFNVAAYKKMLSDAGITGKSIWVTEAEAFYQKNTTADQNYESTKASTTGAISAGAERIFFTRYTFDDFRKDMSEKTGAGTYPSAKKYQELIDSFETN